VAIWARLTLGLICIALSGCASRQILATPLPESRVAIKDYSEMSFQALGLNEAKTIDFEAEKSPVARFPDGLGVYAAFSIDPQSAATALRVRTWFSNSWLSLATVLKPYVIFLDGNKHVVSNVESFDGTLGSTLIEGEYKQGYFPVPPLARFFILYSAATESDRIILVAQSGKAWAIPNVYTGTVEVKREVIPQ